MSNAFSKSFLVSVALSPNVCSYPYSNRFSVIKLNSVVNSHCFYLESCLYAYSHNRHNVPSMVIGFQLNGLHKKFLNSTGLLCSKVRMVCIKSVVFHSDGMEALVVFIE